MKITNFISKKSIALDVHPSTKNEAIDMLIDLLMTAGAVKDKAAVRRDVLAPVYMTDLQPRTLKTPQLKKLPFQS